MLFPRIMTAFSGRRRNKTRLVSCEARKTDDRHRYEGEAGTQWAVTLNVLKELRHEIEEAVEACIEQGA